MCNGIAEITSPLPSKKYGIEWKLERERDGKEEGRKEIGHEGLCILLSWTVKLVSTRPGTNQIEERYGEEEGFRGTIERREIVGYTACYVYYMFCGDS